MPTIISWNYAVGSKASETTAVLIYSDEVKRTTTNVKGILWYYYIANTCAVFC